MPVVDRRDFGGRFSVSENSKRLSNYRYLEIQLMEMIGGWCHTTPQLAFKATFGYHVYDHARNADMLAERMQQLRSGRDREDPGNSEFAHLCEHVWNLESTVDRLVAVYRVLEPHLVSTYVYHADATDPLADTPTVRVLHQLAGTDQSHIAWGQAVLDSLTADPAERKRALAVQADLEERLVACGGVTGQGIESHWLAFASAGGTKTPERPKLGNTTHRFTKRCAPVDHPVVEAPFWFSDTPSDHTSRYVDDASPDGFRSRFHQLLYGEVETTDRMGKMLAEFPELPWEMRLELAHQMWDEARHIEIVAKVVEEELGGELGFGPWSLVWWWMQNEDDPFRRLTVTNCWAERNLMKTLQQWRREAQEQGLDRIADLCDYLQADERMHVRLATEWIRKLADAEQQEELVRWGRDAVARIEGFYAGKDYEGADGVKFTFQQGQAPSPA
jgi:hypothetical protein